MTDCGIEAYVTCWPTEVDRADNATARARLRYQLVFSGSVRVWNLPIGDAALEGHAGIKAGVSGLSPAEMESLGRFLLAEAGKAEAYLDAYRHASTDPTVCGGAQFESFCRVRAGDCRA